MLSGESSLWMVLSTSLTISCCADKSAGFEGLSLLRYQSVSVRDETKREYKLNEEKSDQRSHSTRLARERQP